MPGRPEHRGVALRPPAEGVTGGILLVVGLHLDDRPADAVAVRAFSASGLQFFASSSFSKNFSLYGERVERALAGEPNSVAANANLALVYEAQNRRGEAIAQAAKTLALAPATPEVRHNLGQWLLALQSQAEVTHQLADLVAGKQPGRQDERERALAMNLGLAMDDMAVAPEVYRRARERSLGVWLEL